MNINKLKLDSSKSEDGLWIKYYDAEVKVARIGCVRYTTTLNHEMGKLREEFSAKPEKMTTQMVIDANTKALARCVMGWKGFTSDDEGTVFEYTEEHCEALLLNPQFADLKDWVSNKAGDRDNFRLEEVTKAKKP